MGVLPRAPFRGERFEVRGESRRRLDHRLALHTSHLTPHRKAGRYKLAAPVLKTGSARAEVGAIPTPSAIFQNLKRKESHEARSPLSKPIALSQELPTQSRPSYPSGGEAQLRVPSDTAIWCEAATGTRLVAQEQSTRLITGRRRSVTCRDDQSLLAELRLGEPFPRVAEAD